MINTILLNVAVLNFCEKHNIHSRLTSFLDTETLQIAEIQFQGRQEYSHIADALWTHLQGIRSSGAMMMTWFARNILISVGQ